MSARLLCVVLVAAVGCSRSETSQPADQSTATTKKVTLQLNWYPEAEHGGFYAALENGYYAEEGLEVQIIPGGADVPVVQKVASGGADFGIENADRILLMRAQEADVVAVMAPLQVCPRCLMVHQSTGAESFQDLSGFSIAMNAGEPYAQFLLKNTLPKDVQVVPYNGGVTHFLRGEKNAQQAYSFSEPFLAEEQGSDPKILLVADAGFNPYTSCVFTTSQLVENDPETVRKFVKASVRGWQEYLGNPTPTNAAIHNLNPEMSLDILAYGAKAMKPLCVPQGEETQPFGRMTAERWSALAKQMIDAGVLDAGASDPKQAFRSEFLTENDN